MKDLGYVNDWKEIPEIVKACKARRHVVEVVDKGFYVKEHFCEDCGYRYLIDFRKGCKAAEAAQWLER